MSVLFDYITSSIYGNEVSITGEGSAEDNVKVDIKEESQSGVIIQVEPQPGLIVPGVIIKTEASPEEKIEEKVEEVKVDQPFVTLNSIDPNKVPVIDPYTPNYAQTTYAEGDRHVKITYYSGTGVSIRTKNQIIPGTNTRDGYYEEYYHNGRQSQGPLKLKCTYVNDKKNGYQYEYDQEGNQIKEDYFRDGERVKGWLEWIGLQ